VEEADEEASASPSTVSVGEIREKEGCTLEDFEGSTAFPWSNGFEQSYNEPAATTTQSCN